MIYFIVSYPSLTWNWFWGCLEKGNTSVGCRERVYLSILSILRCPNWHHKNDMICSLDKALIKSVWDISFMMTDKIKTAVVKRTLARLGVDLFTVGRWWWHKYKSTNHLLAPAQLVWMVNLIFCLPVLASNNILFSLHSFKVYIDWNKVMTWYTTGPHSTRPQIQTILNSILVGSIQSHIVENHFPKEKHMFEANRLKASCVLFFFYFVCLFAFLKLPVLCACTARCVLATFHVMHCLRLAYYG